MVQSYDEENKKPNKSELLFGFCCYNGVNGLDRLDGLDRFWVDGWMGLMGIIILPIMPIQPIMPIFILPSSTFQLLHHELLTILDVDAWFQCLAIYLLPLQVVNVIIGGDGLGFTGLDKAYTCGNAVHLFLIIQEDGRDFCQ